MSVTDNELKQHPVTRKLNKTTSLMDFLFLTAKANKQIKLIHHNFSPHKYIKTNQWDKDDEDLLNSVQT